MIEGVLGAQTGTLSAQDNVRLPPNRNGDNVLPIGTNCPTNQNEAPESLGCSAQEEQESGTERGNRKTERETPDRERGVDWGVGGKKRGGRKLTKEGGNKYRGWGDVRKKTNSLRLSLLLSIGCEKVRSPLSLEYRRWRHWQWCTT